MTNERKALNDLSNMVNEYYRRTREHGKAVNTIKQALERLEQLEKENQELKEEIEKESKLSTRATKAYLEKNAENETLKNAIEIILKYEIDLLKIKQFSYEGYVGYCNFVNLLIPTQQEFDLLKEVLGE